MGITENALAKARATAKSRRNVQGGIALARAMTKAPTERQATALSRKISVGNHVLAVMIVIVVMRVMVAMMTMKELKSLSGTVVMIGLLY